MVKTKLFTLVQTYRKKPVQSGVEEIYDGKDRPCASC